MNILEKIGTHIRSKAGGDTLITVALGGVDSIGALIAACDEFGPQCVMAATIHSSFTHAFTNLQMQMVAAKLGVSYTTIDIGRPILEMLDCRIGLGKVETEKIGYTMDLPTRIELIGGIRMVALRAIASRTESLLVGAIASNKIKHGWSLPTAGMFDINATELFTREQIVESIKEKEIFQETPEILEQRSGLDLMPDGGPFLDQLNRDSNTIDLHDVFLIGALRCNH